MAQTIQFDFARTQDTIKGRREVSVAAAKAEQRFTFGIAGNGTEVPMLNGDKSPVLDDTGRPIMKKIFNLNANSGVALDNPANDKILFDAVTAEQAGDADAASELYRTYLNKVQMSVGIPDYHAAYNCVKGDEIKANVEIITTDNGQLISLNIKSIGVVGVVQAPKTTLDLEAKLAAFKMSLGTPAPKAAPAGETPAQKKARERAGKAKA